jgi:hypothetical protein
MIASMQILQDLRVRLYASGLFWGSLSKENAKIWLQPVREITGPENFTPTLPFPAMDSGKSMVITSWSAVEEWQGIDAWDELPCTIRRVDNY